jgi:hypothetical protein
MNKVEQAWSIYTPIDVLANLANDDEDIVRYAVARNENTPANILIKLASDKHSEVRCQVARNANTPIEALVKLATDEDIVIREHVKHNPNTTEVMKLWFENDGFAGMTLAEFIMAAQETQ